MDNLIPIFVVAVLVGFAVWYVIMAKKSGKKCIGCPDNGCCSGSCGGNCSCGSDER